jgi:hypothetical protein
MKKNYPESPSPSSMEVATKVTDLHKRDTQKGISCKWYKIEMTGLVHMVNRVCAAAASAIPGGQRTKDVMDIVDPEIQTTNLVRFGG